MADNLLKAPKKGILKSSSSFEKTEPYRCNSKEMKWDEMNILQTLHPADKDYGHMKIDEPKTPYANYKDPEEGVKGSVDPHSDDETDGLNADLLAKKIQLGSKSLPKALVVKEEDEEEEEDDMYSDETEDERAKRKLFEAKRKLHYNEFLAVKLARKLMETEHGEEDEEEEEKDEDDGDEGDAMSASPNTPTSSNSNTKDHPSNDLSENSSHYKNVNKNGSPDAKDTANIEGD